MQNRIIVAIAPKGSGKTHLIAERVMEMERVAIFDMIHEAAYLCAEPCVGRPREFAEHLRQPEYKVAYRPVIFQMRDEEEYCPEFEPFVKLCYLKGDMWMVIDEAHQICNPRSIPPALLDAVRLGRHRRLNIVFITQSFSAVARPVTENADEFFFWRIIEPNDLDGIRKRCGTEVMEKVKTLRRLQRLPGEQTKPGQMLHWTTYEGVNTVTE